LQLKRKWRLIVAIPAVAAISFIGATAASASSAPTKATVPHLQLAAGDCEYLIDAAGAGQYLTAHGQGVLMTDTDSGQCFTPTDQTPTGDNTYAYEYKYTASGNCITVESDGYLTMEPCSSGDPSQLIEGYSSTDVSGNSDWSLDCFNAACISSVDDQICVKTPNVLGSDVNIEDNWDPLDNPDRCTWAG
jgi:hypothetical protein